ncbi:MAG: GNAT family N-acetyltransferase [Anaerolineae bacterium]
MLARDAEERLRVGPRLYLRRFRRADVERMQSWRPYEELLFLPYNMPKGSRRENDDWFERNVIRSGRRYFALARRDDGQLVGVISLREVRKSTHPASARLGITLGAQFVGQGYGTEGLALFLDCFFGEMGFGVMRLDVAAFNGRAIRVYEKLGFQMVERFYSSPSGTRYPTPEVSGGDEHFVQHRGEHLTLHYEMELTQEAWRVRRAAVFRALEVRYCQAGP